MARVNSFDRSGTWSFGAWRPMSTPIPAPELRLAAYQDAYVPTARGQIDAASSEKAAYVAALDELQRIYEAYHARPPGDSAISRFPDLAPLPPLPPDLPPLPALPPPLPPSYDWSPTPTPALPPTPQPSDRGPHGPQSDADRQSIDRLKHLTPTELARLGRTDKKAFFEALRPAAEEAERMYGVPAAITLAQAALETGWGQHIIPGYNIFGIKGKGPAGTVRRGTSEVYGGRKVRIQAYFARYNNFQEGVIAHGKLFHNGYYKKAMKQWPRDHDPYAFARNITGIYATDPQYAKKLTDIMRRYKLT